MRERVAQVRGVLAERVVVSTARGDGAPLRDAARCVAKVRPSGASQGVAE
jgi:hypothetical protein